MARLSDVLKDLFGLDISEGALVNILSAAREPFTTQTSLIKARLLAGTALASDETGLRVGKANWWLWVSDHGDSAVIEANPDRSKPVVQDFLGEWRPDYWLSDRLGSQTGWATREHQFCLEHRKENGKGRAAPISATPLGTLASRPRCLSRDRSASRCRHTRRPLAGKRNGRRK